MTEAQAAKKILEQGNCGGVSCRGCPDGQSKCKAGGMSVRGVAPSTLNGGLSAVGRAWFETWLREHGESAPTRTASHSAEDDRKAESARKIIAQGGSCRGISCYDNTCPGAGRECGGTGQHADMARAWLREHGYTVPETADPPASAPSRRFSVGDRVVILSDRHNCQGRHGIIQRDDKDGVPYVVRLDDGTESKFYHPQELRLEQEGERESSSPSRPIPLPTEGKIVKRFKIGHWYTYPGHNGGRPFRCVDDGSMSKFVDENGGSAGINSNPPEPGAPHFREVPAPGSYPSTESAASPGIVERITGAVVDLVAGPSPEFNPSSVKSRSQRRRDVLARLSID